MQVVQGDLLELASQGRFDVLVHGCNCFCTMGAGLAKGVRTAFPEAFEADRATKKGDPKKLGTFSAVLITRLPHPLWVVNAYTQLDYRGPGVRVSYDAVEAAFKQISVQFSGLRIGYPRLGAGLGGGDWDVLREVICSALEGQDHTLVEFVPSKES